MNYQIKRWDTQEIVFEGEYDSFSDALRAAVSAGKNFRLDLRGEKLEGEFDSCKFDSCKFDFCEFYSCKFYSCKFYSCEFYSRTFYSCKFDSCEFDSCKFDFCKFDSCKFDSCEFYSCEFYSCEFYSCSFDSCNFDSCKFCFCEMYSIILRKSNLPVREMTKTIGFASKEQSFQLLEQIREAVLASQNSLEMSQWHTCKTTHCIAGWAQHLTHDPRPAMIAGSMLIPDAAHMFYDVDNATARDWLERRGWLE